MGKVLRGYQHRLKAGIYDAWHKGARNVVGVTATGSGKTVTMASMAQEATGEGVIMAHRSELVAQISTAMAAEGLRHNIIAADKTVKNIVSKHMDEIGRSLYDPRAAWTVASVDTLVRRSLPNAHRVTNVFGDEGHHYLAEGKFGKAMGMFPNARGLLMTATPTRADGKGLGIHHDGIAHTMVIGPGLGELIGDGFATPYDVYAPKASDLDMRDVHVTESGEYNQAEVARAVKRSKKIVGDVVSVYREKVNGKRAIVFAVDIEHASTITAAFNAAGTPCELVTGTSLNDARLSAMRRFKAGTTHVLVNVDLFGEGVDVPAVEVVILARPTASFSLYSQMIGRMLRLKISDFLMSIWDTLSVADRHAYIAASEKPRGILIDHVGNIYTEFNVGDVKYRGLPEGFTSWTLDRCGKRKSNAIGAPGDRVCLKVGCFKPYPRLYDACPYCGTAAPEPAQRGTPQQVDGDVLKLSPEVLAALRGEVVVLGAECHVPRAHVGTITGLAIQKNHHNTQVAQYELRSAMALWAGVNKGYTDSENYKRFFYTFGIDVTSAGALAATAANKLLERIKNDLSGIH